ncbi:L-aspartate oxidase [Microbacterium sp. M28]|uniref:L-aspartate oxidase n=1 Tax=Microbacterium sp. M28 TaxID=2962064 RepID=UPI0021F4AF4A|nr:L-aspartate oxidase [Microbacterium sp. M28]UYO98075.1 L-aspartate oxidase [Microbacterium sp. M28]
MTIAVVGCGIAGLTAALHAHEAGHAVTIFAKGALGDGSTPLAQGGVAGVYGAGDSASAHAEDTISAGAGLSDPDAVEVLVSEGAARIAELIARGVAFDRADDGALLLGREAAHSAARIVHAGGDATGAEIARALTAAVRSAGIEIVESAFLIDLLMTAGSVRGMRLLLDGIVVEKPADAVILATGGAGQLFAHTTNPVGATGDGIAAAMRAGAAVADLEFVQFHPTILADGAPFLISEAVRGEGATLIDEDGHRFCFDEHPDGELAPRDVVARAIARRAGRQGAPVRLDASALGARRLAERFPTIDRVTRRRGFDWSREAIPVTPAAHYLMGGIVTDLDGRTTLDGLLAAGETARTGVHGANRLASNSLLEGAVFGARAAAAAVALSRSSSEDGGADRVETRGRLYSADRVSTRSTTEGDGAPAFSRRALQQLMWDHVGLLRRDEGLADALATIHAWQSASVSPASPAEHEDANLLLLAEATASAALARTESVGAHFRERSLIGAR